MKKKKEKPFGKMVSTVSREGGAVPTRNERRKKKETFGKATGPPGTSATSRRGALS